MSTVCYDKLVGKTTNWEDFVVKGVAAMGCCGVDPGLYVNYSACKAACDTQCPADSPVKPGICKTPVVTGPAECCVQCCKAYHTPASTKAQKFCSGLNPINSLSCGSCTTLKIFCRGHMPTTTTTP